MSPKDRDPKIFPDEVQGLFDTTITCLSLTNDFLCFGTDVSRFNPLKKSIFRNNFIFREDTSFTFLWNNGTQ